MTSREQQAFRRCNQKLDMFKKMVRVSFRLADVLDVIKIIF
ncbi:hypothetical protein QFZ31_006695 [Neobacillus niacini]|nr:hypothetical protein [Neobacillus niacini]